MSNTIKILGILFICLLSCKNEKNENQKNEKENIKDEKFTVLLNSEYNNWLSENYGYKQWSPESNDLEIVDEILQKAIENNEFDFIKKPVSKNLKKYYRQYIPYINENGERIIRINAFCEIHKSPPNLENEKLEWIDFDWKNKYLKVMDGGDCYWRVKLNISKKEYEDIRVNGV